MSVEHRGQFGVLGARQRAQHAVDEAGKPRRARVGLGMGDGEIDGGAVGNVEEQDLRGRDMQHVRQRRGVGRQRLFEAAGQQIGDGDAEAQRGDQDGAHQARSRRSSARYCGWPLSLSVSPSSGVAGVDDGGQQLRRRLAGGETRLDCRPRSRRGSARTVARLMDAAAWSALTTSGLSGRSGCGPTDWASALRARPAARAAPA